jgi:hypothetical protein
MAQKALRNVFLSASIPLKNRDARYHDTADVIAIRDSVMALAVAVLPKQKLIWGGHPSITPLIYYVMNKMNLNIQKHVTIYQSKFFEDHFPSDNNKFENIIFTDNLGDQESSIALMRKRMFSENEFVAGVFIGGMEGTEQEYRMFRELHYEALILPIASTGAASKLIYDNVPAEFKSERLIKDYGYLNLFREFLIEKI